MAIPDNRRDLEAIGYQFNGEGECRGCGASLFWYITPREKKMPFSLRSDVESTAPAGALQAHWEVCPARDKFRSGKR